MQIIKEFDACLKDLQISEAEWLKAQRDHHEREDALKKMNLPTRTGLLLAEHLLPQRFIPYDRLGIPPEQAKRIQWLEIEIVARKDMLASAKARQPGHYSLRHLVSYPDDSGITYAFDFKYRNEILIADARASHLLLRETSDTSVTVIEVVKKGLPPIIHLPENEVISIIDYCDQIPGKPDHPYFWRPNNISLQSRFIHPSELRRSQS